jgi:predicted nucleotidyltransferase
MILIEKNIDRLKNCSAHNGQMYLFGSALNSNFNDSDIDFLVKFNHLNYLSTSIIT